MNTFPIENSQSRHAARRLRVQPSRNGISVVESVVVMVLIVGCMFVLLGGTSNSLSMAFYRTADALCNQGQAAATDSLAQNGELIPVSAADKLVRIGVFTACALVFMGYTIYFVSRAESEPAGKRLHGQNSVAEESEELASVTAMLDKRSRIGRLLREEMAEFDSDHLHVSKFMTYKPMIVTVRDSVNDIMKLMITRGFRHLIVVGPDENLVGIISDRDLDDVSGKSVDDIMTLDPIWVASDTPVSIAITMLVQNRISALPVLHENRVVGILTRSDLLVTLQCLLVNVQHKISSSATSLPPSRSHPQQPIAAV